MFTWVFLSCICVYLWLEVCFLPLSAAHPAGRMEIVYPDTFIKIIQPNIQPCPSIHLLPEPLILITPAVPIPAVKGQKVEEHPGQVSSSLQGLAKYFNSNSNWKCNLRLNWGNGICEKGVKHVDEALKASSASDVWFPWTEQGPEPVKRVFS